MRDDSKMSRTEMLRAENEFLKMKLMLEHGAQFGYGSAGPIPAEVENLFLKNIVEIEKNAAKKGSITVYEKLGRPSHFKRPEDISEQDIKGAWHSLREYMADRGVCITVNSEQVSERDLYRFSLDELFKAEIADFDVPGMTSMFIYDEFHADIAHRNCDIAMSECVRPLLSGDRIEDEPFSRNRVVFNGRPLTVNELNHCLHAYKKKYESLAIKRIKQTGCHFEGKRCEVTGEYHLMAHTQKENLSFSGTWSVHFRTRDLENWHISRICIDGIPF